MRIYTKCVTLFTVVLILFAGCLPVSSPIDVTTSTAPEPALSIATATSTPAIDNKGSDGKLQGWAVLAERDN